MVAAVLLSTCRYILQFQQPENPIFFARLALQYKQICLQALRQEVNMNMNNYSATVAAPVSTMTVATALALALDEVGNNDNNGPLPFWKLMTWYVLGEITDN
jgi:hypothetical protein